MGFSTVSKTRVPPAHTVLVPPSAWSTTWVSRPKADVAVGFRPLSARETEKARAEAAKDAVGAIPEGDRETLEERFRAMLVAWAVGMGTTDPNDATKPYFPEPDDTCRDLLTPEGMALLFEGLERAHVVASPLSPEATDDEIATLPARAKALGTLDPAKARRVRRLIKFCLDSMPEGSAE